MIRNETISTRFDKLAKIKSSLTKEQKEYEKYRDYLDMQNDALLESNTKLLNSLKEKYSTCIILLKRRNLIDITLNDQIKVIKNRKRIKKAIDQVLNSKKDDSKQIMSPKEAIDSSIRIVKHEVKELYSRLQLFRLQNLYEEKILVEIEELKKKKEKLEDQKRLSEDELKFYKKQFKEISQYNGCHNFTYQLAQLSEKIKFCQRLRQDKLEIINFHQQMHNTQSFHNKIKGLNPDSVLIAFDISLNSDASTDDISSLCQSTDHNGGKNKKNHNNDQNQIGSLTSTEVKFHSNNNNSNFDDSNQFSHLTPINKKNSKMSNVSKDSHTSATDSQKSKSYKFSDKRQRIIKEISTNGRLEPKNKANVKSDSAKKESGAYYNDDDYLEDFYSTTSYSHKKRQESSSNASTQYEKSEQSKRDEKESSKRKQEKLKRNSESSKSKADKNESSKSKADKYDSSQSKTDKNDPSKSKTDKNDSSKSKTDKYDSSKSKNEIYYSRSEANSYESENYTSKSKKSISESNQNETDKSESSKSKTHKSKSNESEVSGSESNKSKTNKSDKNKSNESEVKGSDSNKIEYNKNQTKDEDNNTNKDALLPTETHKSLNLNMNSDIPKAKSNDEIQSNDSSRYRFPSDKSYGSLSSYYLRPDGTRRRKHVPERIPVILPEKASLFVHLLHKHHKERVKSKDGENIQLLQTKDSSRSSFDISSSQAFYNEFNDTNEYQSFLKKNAELGIAEFDTFTQTDESFRTIIAAILNDQLQRFLNEDKINDSIYKKRCQLDEIEASVSAIHREVSMMKRKKENWIKSFKIDPPEKLNMIDINIVKDVQKVDSINQTEQIVSISEIRDEIIKNSKLNPKSFLKKMEHRDLVAMLTKKKLELKITNMTNVRKQLDINSLLKRLKIVDPLMYSAETHEPAQIEVDRNIIDKKQQKLDKIASLDRHFKDVVTEGKMLSAQITDQQYLVDAITNYLTDMAKEPKSNVQRLCHSLKEDRSSINEVNRQIKFVTIENDSISKEIGRYDEMVSTKNLMGMNQKVDNLYKYLTTLKTRFNTLRAVKEKRSYVMTCEEEMNSLQRQINIVLSEIDVYRMRINGTISKIEKQTRSIISQNIRNPKPISNLTWNGKSKSSHKL